MKLKLSVLFLMITTVAFAQKKSVKPVVITPSSLVNENQYYRPLLWRNVGPTRGGRAVTATGVIGNNQVYYMGTTGGGVWKTEDAGINWMNISDGFFNTGSVGAVAVAASDPNVVYVGMGEHAPRGVMSSYGDGIYKSTDAGKSWKHIGLSKISQTANIRIHPNNPDIVYVAAQGAIHGATSDRGVYKSIDGGVTWTKTLFVDDNTGCVDLSMDLNNPRILYAAMWDYRRTPWEVRSGGAGSGLYKSVDGGDTWKKIEKGLPKEMGKMSVAVSKANSNKVYLVLESDSEKEQGGMFVSNDGGESWDRVSKDHRLVQRAWYYIECTADPIDENTVYVFSSPAIKSTDGGKTWQSFRAPHGDYHQLWINPNDNKNMIVSNDGGAAITFNTGKSWSSQDNQPTAQFYRVNADNMFPYNLYGGQQDNTSVKIASGTTGYGITNRDWSYSAGGESAFLAFDPNNPRYVLGGSYQGTIEVLDTKISQGVNVMVAPIQYQALQPKDMKYRFNWNAPIVASMHEPNTFYHAGNILFKSSDFGKSWKAISPDLTTHDTSKMGMSGTPYTNEGAGGENYCTITYVIESMHEKGLIYTGSDDGMVYITKDGGAHWTNITPDGVKGALVNAIEVSPFDKGTVYLAVNKYKFNDLTPMIYISKDYGQTWKKATEGIPYGAYVRVVREDNKVKDLLYVGTETGFYISRDGGAHYNKLQLNLPIVPITDLKLHQDHLLASTQGRAFWILDDLTPLRKSAASLQTEYTLLPISDVYRTGSYSALDRQFTEEEEPNKINTLMQNPASGAVIYYHIAKKENISSLQIKILDANNTVIRTYYKDKPKPTSNNATEMDPAVLVRTGLNRFVWDLRHTNLPDISNVFIEGSNSGRTVVPGTYTAQLIINDTSVQSASFKVLADPRITASAEDFAEQDNYSKMTSEDIEAIHVSVVQLRKVQAQLSDFANRTENNKELDSLRKTAESIRKAIVAWEEHLIQPKSQSNDDVINFVNKLSANFIFLKGEIDGNGNIPYLTQGQKERYHELHNEWLIYLKQKNDFIDKDIKSFNEACSKANWKYIGFENE